MNSPTTILHSIQFMKNKLKNEREQLRDLKKDFNIISRNHPDEMDLGDVTKKISNQNKRRVKTINDQFGQTAQFVSPSEDSYQSNLPTRKRQHSNDQMVSLKKIHRKQIKQLQQAHEAEKNTLIQKHNAQMQSMQKSLKSIIAEQSDYIHLLEEEIKNKNKEEKEGSNNQKSQKSENNENRSNQNSNQPQSPHSSSSVSSAIKCEQYNDSPCSKPRTIEQYQFIVNQLLRDNQLLIEKLQQRNKEIGQMQNKHQYLLNEIERIRGRDNQRSKPPCASKCNQSVSVSSRSQSRLKFNKHPSSIPSMHSRMSSLSMLNDENIDSSNISRLLQPSWSTDNDNYNDNSYDNDNDEGISQEEGKMKTIRGMVDGRGSGKLINAMYGPSAPQKIKNSSAQGYLSLKI